MLSLTKVADSSEFKDFVSNLLAEPLNAACIAQYQTDEDNSLKSNQEQIKTFCECSTNNLIVDVSDEEWKQVIEQKLNMTDKQLQAKALSASGKCIDKLVK